MLNTLSPETWPFELEWLPQPAYLVGGAVRDALLQRLSPYLDLDFVLLTQAVKTASKISRHYKAGYVLLDAARQIARVVFPDCTADFAQAEGDSLEADLRRRDFTINAIAYNPFTGEIIDPLQGQADLQQRLLRMVSAANLQDDPLRLLRAYRQAAQLGFEIEAETQSVIRQLAPCLSQIAVERVRTELGHLLHHSQGIPWLQKAWEDGLLSQYFPTAHQRFSQLAAMGDAVELLAKQNAAIREEVCRPVRETIKTSLLAIAKLAALLTPDLVVAEAELVHLKYSNIEKKFALGILRYLPLLVAEGTSGLSIRDQYFLFRDLGNGFPALAVVAVAAKVLPERILPLLAHYFTPDDLIAHPTPLLNGETLMAELNLPKGKLIGELLTEIAIARAEGKIATVAEALVLAAGFVESSGGAEINEKVF